MTDKCRTKPRAVYLRIDPAGMKIQPAVDAASSASAV